MSTIITHRQFPGYHKYEMELAGRPLTLEVGKLAELANAAVMVGYGDTRVLVCATASARPRDGIDFFPLSVDFEEKMYAVGRIPGSFNRREGRPGEKGILTSRVIDRPIRPLFPYDFRNDVSIMATVMAVDHDCSPEIAALIGTSAALAISDIPWNGPVGAVKMGLVDGELVINPTSEQRKVSDLDHSEGPRGEPEADRADQQDGRRDRQAQVRLSPRRLRPGAVRRHRGQLHGRGQGRYGHR